MESSFTTLRRRIANSGARSASAIIEPPARSWPGGGQRLAAVVEQPFRHHDVGSPESWDEVLGFLDGRQRAELIGYVGIHPIVAATVHCAARLRSDRRMHTAVEKSRRLVIGRPDALKTVAGALDGCEAVPIEGEDFHPIRDLDRAHDLVDAARSSLEIATARAFRMIHDGWIVVDGPLALSPDWSRDPRMVGIVKHHGAVALSPADYEVYLTVPHGHRTSAFAPGTQRLTPVYAWGLRLWPWEGHDLLHGLVRVETAATNEALGLADLLARRIMAERTPVVAGPGAHRELYGIHDVGRYLRARGA